MKVIVYGAGRFGRTLARVFSEFDQSITDVTIFSPGSRDLTELPKTVRVAADFGDQDAEVVVICASCVPSKERESLAYRGASIEKFWDLERQYNLHLMHELVSPLKHIAWRLLIIATNPVHEWVNAYQCIFPNRSIIGLGTAFDDQRIRLLTAAMLQSHKRNVIRTLRIVGGHGAALGISGGAIPNEMIEAAKWMSNALSADLIRAPEQYAEEWWTRVAIEPLARGLAGNRTRTHLVAKIRYAGVEAATGIDVSVKGLDIRPLIPREISAQEHRAFIAELQMRQREGKIRAAQLLRPLHRPRLAHSGSYLGQ